MDPTPAGGTAAYPIPTYDVLVYRNALDASLAMQPCSLALGIVVLCAVHIPCQTAVHDDVAAPGYLGPGKLALLRSHHVVYMFKHGIFLLLLLHLC